MTLEEEESPDVISMAPMPTKAYSVGTVSVEAPLMEKLVILAQKSGSELSTILLAAWILVVSQLSAQDTVIISVVKKENKGYTVHALPMHVEPAEMLSTLQLIDRVNRTFFSGFSPSRMVDGEFAPRERILPSQSAFYLHNDRFAFPTPDNVSVRCDLELHMLQDKNSLALGIRRASDLYNEGAIERYAGYLKTVLMHMTANNSQPIDSFDILSPEEKHLLETWNQTDAEYPDRCIQHFFEEQVESSPEAVAVVHNEQKFTYGELNLLATRFAFQLLEAGVKHGDSVAMLLERSVELVAAQLAVLKAGAAYVPIDPRAPLERQAFILKDSGAVLLVTNTNTEIPSTLELPLHRLDISLLQATGTIELAACASGSSSDTAYVMYTSGSTGVPKAVVVPHRAITCRVFANGFADIGSSDRVAFATNPSHVPSTFDIWATFLRGARMVIMDNDIVLDPHRLAAALIHHQVTSLYMTNPLLQQYAFIIGDTLSTLKYLIGGADLGTTKAYSAVLKHGGQVRMVHRFGSTETPLGATAYMPSINVDQLDHLPIGRPVPNIRCYVLDQRLMLAPIGVIGELYVGGSGIATRYLNRPDITAERFLPDPFSNVPGAFMYKTGDMVRYLPDGNLVFMGRNDFQVKIRGYRIELGEIESRLVSHRLVKNAAVLGVGDGDGKRLVAYVAADPNQNLADTLREYLALSLPEYMIPAAFVQLDELPLTIRGKIDRTALPIYDFSSIASSQEDYAPPQGDMEMMLAELWSELLKVERVGRGSNFFMLGGHSLIAIRMIERLRRLGYTMSVRTLFETPVLHTLASSLRQYHSSPAAPPNLITPTSTTLTPDMLPLISLTQGDIENVVNQVPGGVKNVQDIYGLSPLQDGILFHHMMAKEADPYLITVCAAFRNRELLDHYLSAYQRVVDRHDILRTAILWENMSTPAQVVLRHVPLPVTEHSLDPADGPVVNQLMRLYDPRTYRLNMNTAPLIRLATTQDNDGRWILLELHHHIIGDRSTTEVLQEEIKDILAGGFERLPAPEPYRNLIAEAYLRGVSVSEQETFFHRMLQDIEIPSLLYGMTNIYSDGCDVTDFHCTLPQDLNTKLRGHSRRLGVSLASLCHLAWARVVGSLSGQDQVVFGTVLFGRMQGGEGSDRALGLFVNTLPFRVDVGETSVQESVHKVQTDLAALLQYEHASLANAQRQSGVPMGMPLFNALMNYRHNTAPDQKKRAAGGIETIATLDRTNYPFTMSVEDYGSSSPSALGLAVQVVQPYDPVRICSYMQQALENLAQALEHSPQTPVQAVSTLPADEHDLLIHGWNNTETPFPGNFCIHQLFENQARSSPEVIAIVHNDRSMTYSELDARGNKIARQIVAAGVKAGDHVAIMLDRSIDHVAMQIAILKTGAAYVPIDTKAPLERQSYIASDSGVKLLLTDERTVVPTQIEVPVLRLGANVDLIEDSDTFDSACNSTSSADTAYIMYTSGSTGRPKGVMVPHRGISRLFFNNALATIGPGDCMAFASNPAFDQSVYEIWAPLLTGARLVVIDHDTILNPHRLAEELVRHEVTFLRLTNAVIQQYAGIIGHTMSKLKYLIGAGEQGSLKGYSAIVKHGGSVCLINSLGTTETTVDASMYVATSAIDHLDRLPIGRPISNTRLYVLDKNRKPVPLGVTGEMYIGGPGVANGYLNRPELTAERFVLDPFSNAPEARMYKTGDLARWLPDGNLIYLGRDDFQVKIRGFRIELGEIEERLSEHPQVHEAVVVATGEGGDKRLVAYVVAAADDRLAASLRDHLASILPEYMIPSAFVRMDIFPLNNNGKVDRRALPEPDSSSLVTNEYSDPVGDIECALVEIWTELLKVERVGRHDNFFLLGGHSLLAVRLMNRLSTILGVQISLSTLYQTPTLSGLAEVLSNSIAQEDMSHLTISRANREGPLELSFSQQRLWFLAQMEGVSEIYHVPTAFRLHGTLDKDSLQKALNSLFARHEALRTVFVSTNGQPQVQVLPASSGWTLAYHDLRAEKDREAVFENLRAQQVSMPFDLEKGPLVRALLIQLSEKEQALLFTLHHIIVDGWSLGVLFRDLSDLYTAYCSGMPDPLTPLSIQYPDYAAWQRQWLTEDRLKVQATFWNKALAGAPVTLALPTDRPRPRQQSFVGGSVPIRLDAQLTTALHTLCQKHGVTMFMAILAAWSAVLSRLSGQDDIVIGTPVANRNHPQVEQLIGFFVNTLALRMDLSGEPNVEQILDRVRKTTIAAQAHQDMPFEQVVEIVQPPRRMDQTPIFQVLLAWQNSELGSLQLQDVEAIPARMQYDIAKFDQELFIGEENGKMTGSLRYSSALFDHETIERHVGYLEAMLRWMTGITQQSVGVAPILGSSEQKLLLETWNDTDRPYPATACIHHLFEKQANSSPDAIAIVQNDRSMTYRELGARANWIAHQLVAAGVNSGEHVAILLERSIDLVASQIAILKVGAAYVPIDTKAPVDRKAYMVADSGARFLVTDEAMLVPDQIEAAVLRLGTKMAEDTQDAIVAHVPASIDTEAPVLLGTNVTKDVQDRADLRYFSKSSLDTAYVMYTSGSTGLPKGVMVSHRGIARLTINNGWFDVGPGDRVAFGSNTTFDLSTLDVWTPLLNGGCVVILGQDTILNAHQLEVALERHQVNALQLPTAIFHQYAFVIGSALSRLKYLLFAGEQGLIEACTEVLRHGGPVRLINAYGPTETVYTTSYAVTDAVRLLDRLPIGQPINNTRLYVLDKHRNPVPIGVVGELYVAGPGVANGYLNRPDLTKERFLPDPFSNEPHVRMYRTGDLVRYLPDGSVVYIGRTDFQVKIRGFRIEIGEIEARLAEHPRVREVVVLAVGESGDKRLVAYVVASPFDNFASNLRKYLTACLPEYMVPSAFVRMDVMPLTNNGKADRRALPEPDSDSFITETYVAPEGEIEMTMADLWAAVLKVDRVGRYDNFFMLGGHSLLAVRLMNRLSTTLGVQLSLSAIFQSPTLSGLAEVIKNHNARDDLSHSKISPAERDGPLELSFAQQRLWFLAQMDGVSETYRVPVARRLRGNLNQNALQQALDNLFARHESLRSVFVSVSDQPKVLLLPANSGLPLVFHNLRNKQDKEALANQLAAQEVATPFELEKGPLVRALLIQLADDEHFFLLTMHHITTDGWSLGVLFREVNELYAAAVARQPNPLAPLSIQYPDYALWQRQQLTEDRLEDQAAYWHKTLAGAPVTLALPTDRPRPRQQSFVGGSVPIRLDAQLTTALHTLCQKHGVTMFMAILAAWSAVLSRLSGQDDIVIGTPVANRNHPQVEQLIGFFVNTLALRMDLSGEPNVEQILDRVRKTTIAAQAHQDMPFEQVVEIVQPPRRMDQTPIFQAMFAWQNNDLGSLQLQDVEATFESTQYDLAKFDLSLEMHEESGEVIGGMQYAIALFDNRTIERHVGYLKAMLRWMTVSIEGSIDQTPILDPSEHKLLVHTWNETDRLYPDNTCIHRLFESQVKASPHAIAIVHADRSITYRELNSRAYRIARQLVAAGVNPGDHVLIHLDRSVELVAVEIAVLKAGAVYIPLDPHAPVERQMYIATDCAAKLVVTDERTNLMSKMQLPQLRLCSNEENFDSMPDLVESTSSTSSSSHGTNSPSEMQQPQFSLGPKKETFDSIQDLVDSTSCTTRSSYDTAYVMYTSGSTGLPKGVMVSHRGIASLAFNNGFADFVPDDRVAFSSNPSFDPSTFEVWAPLLNGASIVIIDRETFLDPHRLAEALLHYQVTFLHMTNALLHQYAFIIGEPLSRLRYLTGAAEQGSIEAYNAVLQYGGPVRVINRYGPTEATVDVTAYTATTCLSNMERLPIGQPVGNTRVYVLDKHLVPVPIGVAGELYIGGPGVANGYLNRPELTSERFVPDPFSTVPGARMYKTGDLVRYLSDGELVFLGRRDNQIKIRGYRVELGEIEVRLVEHPTVREAVVVVTGEGSDKRLIAYVVSATQDNLARTLREHVLLALPEYMVPSAFVRLDAMPLNNNGKVDRQALPTPDPLAFVGREYETPQGTVEIALADVWASLLRIEQVGRHDNFFMLGGHSLLAVKMIEQLRRLGYSLSVRTLFDNPVLHTLAASIRLYQPGPEIPPNLITPTTTLTPDVLPLINLTQGDIDTIVNRVPGGVTNIQDIYELSPLQEGILFHHLLASEGDPYLTMVFTAFRDRVLLDRYLDALQKVVDRHDILRTTIMWENMSTPAQVVLRKATLFVTEHSLDPADGPIVYQLKQQYDPRKHRIDLSLAPLTRLAFARDSDGRWIMLQLIHHLIGDHSTQVVIDEEIEAILGGDGNSLPVPQPFRNLIAQARLGVSVEDHERFFHNMLHDIDTPSLPFGLSDVYNHGGNVIESHKRLPQDLNYRLRGHAKRLGVSLAAICHLAWATVIASLSGQDRVVFGTVLFGRMQGGSGSDRAMGLFINTLPFRADVDGNSVLSSVRKVQTDLAALLEHEHASLARAQRLSGVPSGMPLFSSLLNYRHNVAPVQAKRTDNGMQHIEAQERDNYPLAMSVEDFEHSLGLTAQVVQPHDPSRICDYMQQALQNLANALEQPSEIPIQALHILPAEEHELVVHSWNKTDAPFPSDRLLHQLFEDQAERAPRAVAMVQGDISMTYGALNARADRLACTLIDMKVQPGDNVALLFNRSFELIIAQVAILKAGAAYVPIDVKAPASRQAYILSDSGAKLLLTDDSTQVHEQIETPLHRLSLKFDHTNAEQVKTVPHKPTSGLHTACVMYTSGSTGLPKGVLVPHRAIVCRLINNGCTVFTPDDCIAFVNNPSFDPSTSDVWGPLLHGARIAIIDNDTLLDANHLSTALDRYEITSLDMPSALFHQYAYNIGPALSKLRYLVCGGEQGSIEAFSAVVQHGGPVRIFNAYGPTETTVNASMYEVTSAIKELERLPIGRPIGNTRVYVLNKHLIPVPIGVAGELYIGGPGVANGYLNRPELTSERFVPDPFSTVPGARMYKTGDLVRYLSDGELVFLGRRDNQIKIRGYRVELGEIEVRLVEHSAVREAVVVATGEGADKRLVAYVVVSAAPDENFVISLRQDLAARLPEYMVPSAFFYLDVMPLTSNGKVDRRALPDPESTSFVVGEYVAPQDEDEVALAVIWCELLKINKIGRHDDFFMLGGHSLLALRMIGAVRTRLGIELKLQWLFSAPSIAELVQIVRQDGVRKNQDDEYSVLLPLKMQGKRSPLFCIHPAFGMSWSYRGLVPHLHPEQPLYGLQARGLDGKTPLATSVEEMTLDYINQIRKVQPHGPYHLLGWSFGGTVAHNMAVEFEKRGEQVRLLVIMDSLADYSQLTNDSIDEEEKHISAQDFLGSLAAGIGSGTQVNAEDLRRRVLAVSTNSSRLAIRHSPSVVSGGVTFLRAAILTDDTKPLVDPATWKPLSLGEIEVHDVQCMHEEMNKPEHIAVVGRVVAARLEELQRVTESF